MWYLVLWGKVQSRFNHSLLGQHAGRGFAFFASNDYETTGVLRTRAHSSGKVPPDPWQSALQPCQKQDLPASSGLETFATIDVKTQFSVEKKAMIWACGMAGSWNNAFSLGCFVTRELKPFALSQWTIPLSSLPIALLGLFRGSLSDFFFFPWMWTPREHKQSFIRSPAGRKCPFSL